MAQTIRKITSERWETETREVSQLGRHMPLAEFLENFGDNLCAAVNANIGCQFDHGGPVDPRWIRELSSGIRRNLKSAQLRTVCALMDGYATGGHRGLFLDGQPGTGKTTVSVALAWLLHKLAGSRNTIIVSPPHLVNKWEREITEILGNRARTVVLNDSLALHKLQELRNSPKSAKPLFVIASSVRIRWGKKWRPACDFRVSPFNKEMFASCPGCGHFLTVGNEMNMLGCISRSGLQAQGVFDGQGRITQPGAKTLPAAYHAFYEPSICPFCSTPLWSEKRGNKKADPETQVLDALRIARLSFWETKRVLKEMGWKSLHAALTASPRSCVENLTQACWRSNMYMSAEDYRNIENVFRSESYPLADFIKRKMRKFFDLCILDECHEFKNESARGAAAQMIASQSKRVLAATGTMIGGYADDLPMLLSIVAPESLKKRGYDVGVENPRGFTSLYGAQRVRQVSSNDSSLMRARSSVSRQPGLSPRAALEFITPRCAYMKMSEINKQAKPRTEIITVDMGAQLKETYRHMERDTINYLQTHSDRIGARVVQALLAYTTTCWMPQIIENPGTGEALFYAPAVYGGHNERTPKERKVIELCRAEVNAGRKVLVYSDHVIERPQIARYADMLRRVNLEARELKANSIRAADREKWLARIKNSTDVLVTNPDVVKTGLDLVEYRTMIFTDVGLDPYTVQQAMSRASRYTQKGEVRVFFICYRDCWETKMAYLLAKKLQAMSSFAGEVPQTGYDAVAGNPYLDIVAEINRLSGNGGGE